MNKGSIREAIFPVLIALLVLGFWRQAAFAQNISSTKLINSAKEYDGKIVSYSGEVIGDIMKRGAFAWINVNDGENAIGIWAPVGLLKEINYSGSYKSRGDIIEVTGVFNRACKEHGADLDIHAEAIKKINSGSFIQEKPNMDKKNQVAILLGILGAVWILTLLKNK